MASGEAQTPMSSGSLQVRRGMDFNSDPDCGKVIDPDVALTAQAQIPHGFKLAAPAAHLSDFLTAFASPQHANRPTSFSLPFFFPATYSIIVAVQSGGQTSQFLIFLKSQQRQVQDPGG